MRNGIVYAMRRTQKKGVFREWALHREVLGMSPEDPLWVDHRDGDGLNCRRANVRKATPSLNAHNRKMRADNTSGYMGVSLQANTGRWRAALDKKTIGEFDTAEEANEARLAAECRKYGIQPRRADAHK